MSVGSETPMKHLLNFSHAIYLKEKQGEEEPNPSLEYCSCRTEHRPEVQLRKGGPLHILFKILSSPLISKKPRPKSLKGGSWIPVYAGPL